MRIFAMAMSIFLIAGTAISGTIGPELELKMENASPGQQFETLVFMKDQIDLTSHKQDINFISATRAQRHRIIITELRRIATESQPDLLSYLSERRAAGAIGEFRGFWICNMIIAELTPAEIRAIAARDDVAEVHSNFKGELIEPVKVERSDPPVINSVEIGVRAIKADSMWTLGYTGQGRLVCNIDTGVDGNHEARTDIPRLRAGMIPPIPVITFLMTSMAMARIPWGPFAAEALPATIP